MEEQEEKLLAEEEKLRKKLERAEQARQSGAPVYTLEEARERLMQIYQEEQ